MDPRLLAVAGPLTGSVHMLSEGQLSIGRDPTNDICLVDVSVSRRHCLLVRSGDKIELRDLESLNGTFVNGVPVRERALEPGDQVKVGDSLFHLIAHDENAAGLEPLQLQDDTVVATATVVLHRETALYLQPEQLQKAVAHGDRVSRDLNALLKISTALNAIRSPEDIQAKLLEFVFEVVPAERGAILLVQDGQESFVPAASRDRNGKRDVMVRVSRAVAEKVLRERVGVLTNDVQGAGLTNPSGSLVTSLVRSLMAVPLLVHDRIVGIIYLDTTDSSARFGEQDLQLMTGVAAVGALAIDNARHVQSLVSENQRLLADLGIEHNMVGESPRIREVQQFIARAAPTSSTVLIRGESGTGKELVARAIHRNSPRSDRPFVAINCAALTESLLESELFGHEKGAFTGAVALKKGKLEIADSGTLFLDEVGELGLTLQSKLLRVLQEHEFERVGGTRPIRVDIRLIAATNKNLEEAIKNGTFRQDLYYRLNVLAVTVAPLRERRSDIALLASYFVAKYSETTKRRVIGISQEARSCLIHYDWPGNVRELENAIERAVVLGGAEVVMPEDLPEALLDSQPSAGGMTRFSEGVKQAKKQLILKAIEQAGGSYAEAARLLGVHPNNLHRLIRSLNLRTVRTH